MSQAEELLNSLAEESYEAGAGDKERHIVIGRDRTITVPEELRKIGVQFDNNVETVTFDCPRYWDKHDMSTMTVYINYMREDGYIDKAVASKPVTDATDDGIMHFDWTISANATQVKGALRFLVCIKKTDADGNEATHWNSELNEDMYIVEGLECDEAMVTKYPDIITDLLVRMEKAETVLDMTWVNATDGRLDTIEQTLSNTTDALEKTTSTARYSSRPTGGGLTIADGHKTTVKKVVGDTLYGKNLFDIDNLFNDPRNATTVTKTSEGLRVVANIAYAGICFAQLDGLTIGENYTLSFDYIATVASAEARFGLNTAYTDTNTNMVMAIPKNSPSGKLSATFTATAKTMYFGSYFHRGPAGANGELNDITLSNIQIEKGDTATEYEPYSGEKRVTFGGIKSIGKNICKPMSQRTRRGNYDEFGVQNNGNRPWDGGSLAFRFLTNNNYTYRDSTDIYNYNYTEGALIMNNDENTVTFRAPSMTGFAIDVPCVGGKRYCYSVNRYSTDKMQLLLSYFRADGSLISFSGNGKFPYISEVAPADAVWLCCTVRCTSESSNTVITVGEFQVEEGSTPTAYEPYKESVLEFPKIELPTGTEIDFDRQVIVNVDGTETPFTDEQKEAGNSYVVYKGGTEIILDNEGSEYDVHPEITQTYITYQDGKPATQAYVLDATKGNVSRDDLDAAVASLQGQISEGANPEQLNEVYNWYMGVDSGDEVPAAKHAMSADRATCDSDGNQFDEHYVTNEVFSPQITKIDDVFEWYQQVTEADYPVPKAGEADRADQASRDRLGNLIDETYAKNDTVIEDVYLYVLDPRDNDYGYDFIVWGEYSGVDHAKNGDKLYIEGVDGYGVVHTDFENDAKEELDDYLQGYPFIGVDVDDSNQAFRNVLEAWTMDGGDQLANIKFVRGGSVTFANEAKYAKKLATSEWTQVAFDMSKGTASIPEYGTYEIAVCSSHDMGIRASFGIHTIDSGELRLPAVKLGWSVKSGYNYMDKETDFRIVVTDKTAILYVYKTEYYYEVQNGVISSGHGRVQATIDLATSAITNNTYYLLYRKISD